MSSVGVSARRHAAGIVPPCRPGEARQNVRAALARALLVASHLHCLPAATSPLAMITAVNNVT